VKPSYDTYVHPVSFIFTLVNDLFWLDIKVCRHNNS
jgi:hypothetical protein